jgi:hypothetical protein
VRFGEEHKYLKEELKENAPKYASENKDTKTTANKFMELNKLM